MTPIHECMDQFTPAELTRLTDYFAEELSPEEVEKVERWIEGRADLREFVDELRLSRISLDTSEVDKSWNLKARVDSLAQSLSPVWYEEPLPGRVAPEAILPTSAKGAKRSDSSWPIPRSVWYTMGAVAASVVMVVSGWYVGMSNKSVTVAGMHTYSTGKGERATVTLPDGSAIFMNVGSRIQVPADYSASNRTIQLSGEALFNVVPLHGEPFTVVSGPSTTKVLGTSFTVRHYESDSAAFVAVREGKVSVGSAVLTAQQAAVITSAGQPRVMQAEPRQFAFERGVLEIHDIRFPQAIDELSRWYDVDIRLGDSALGNQKIWGTFEAGSITDLISILEFTFNVRVVRDGRVLTLYGGI